MIHRVDHGFFMKHYLDIKLKSYIIPGLYLLMGRWPLKTMKMSESHHAVEENLQIKRIIHCRSKA